MPKLKHYRKVLDNGLRIVLIPMENTDLISMGIFTEAGSRYETEDNNGIAHFLEHMLFQETRKYSKDLTKKLENAGALYNATTSSEFTYYEIHGSAKDTHMFLDIIIDLYLHPIFSKKSIDTEKGVVIEEINMGKDNKGRMITKDLYRMMYKGTKMEMPVIGTEKNVRKFNKKYLEDFRYQLYIPKNTAVVICGKFDKNKVYKLIKRSFRREKNPNVCNQLERFVEYQEKPQLLLKEIKDRAQTLVIIAFHSFDLYNENSVVLDVIGDILSNGLSSRLVHLLRTKMGAAYFANAIHEPYLDHGVFYVYLGIDNTRIIEIVGRVLKELSKLKRTLVPNEELKKVKKMKDTVVLFNKQPRDYFVHYGFQELFYKDKFESVELILNRYKKVTPTMIKNIANQIFVKNNMNIVIHGKKVSKNKIAKLMKNF